MCLAAATILVAVVSAMATADRLEHAGNSGNMEEPFIKNVVIFGLLDMVET